METEKRNLKKFFSIDQPLSEVSAVSKTSELDRAVFKKYFDASNRPFSQIRTNPTMIVGRRGSGKTDALMSHQFRDDWETRYRPIVLFNADGAESFFSSIVHLINDQIHSQLPTPMVESVSKLWTYVFGIILLHQVSSVDIDLLVDPSEKYAIRDFVDQHGDLGGKTEPSEITYEIVITLLEKYDNLPSARKKLGFFTGCTNLIAKSEHYEKMLTTVYNSLRESNCTAVILIDSFEEFNVVDEYSHLALSGLLRSVARFHESNTPVEMRCSIPAEAYFYVADISSNRIKDFQKQTTLHWSAMEIMGLCATRFAAYIELNLPEHVSELVTAHDLTSRKGISDFWGNFLPRTVPNLQPGLEEETIPYLLRHTQLLPRHMILLLNRIFSAHLVSGNPIYELSLIHI